MLSARAAAARSAAFDVVVVVVVVVVGVGLTCTGFLWQAPVATRVIASPATASRRIDCIVAMSPERGNTFIPEGGRAPEPYRDSRGDQAGSFEPALRVN